MIEIFNQELGENSDFIKYSTAISGTGMGNKVLFFGFKKGQKFPWVVAKTVRSYKDAQVVREGNKNLKRLNALTKNTEFEPIFPQALLVYDDGYNVFNAETVCIGKRAELKTCSELVLRSYTAFQKHIFHLSKDTLDLNINYGKRLIEAFEGPSETIETITHRLEKLWAKESVRLPALLQHGDLTIDNVLLADNNIKIIDCDIFGNIQVPGFDVFHLLFKGKVPGWKLTLQTHLSELGIDYWVDEKLIFIYFLHELYIKRDYILKNKSPKAIIEEFDAML